MIIIISIITIDYHCLLLLSLLLLLFILSLLTLQVLLTTIAITMTTIIITFITLVGHRSRANRICRNRDFVKYGLGLRAAIISAKNGAKEKGSLWPA